VADKSMESSEFKTTQFGRFVMRAENKAKKLKEASHRIPVRHPKQSFKTARNLATFLSCAKLYD